MDSQPSRPGTAESIGRVATSKETTRRILDMKAKRILVPLDGSESSEAAAAVAADLARGSGGCVRLVQVYPVPQQLMGAFGRVVAYADQEMERLTGEGRDYLESVEARLGSVPAESVVRFGEPAEEILTEAEAFDADAIVLTTARRTGLSRLGRGGLGERLLHDSTVPVVLVRAA
jgi:nucleotide-binding universal stress UspA family protein